MTTRRFFLGGGAGLMAGMAGALLWGRNGRAASRPENAANKPEKFEVSLSDADWRRKLTAEQYTVLRQEGTERAFTSPLLKEHRRGVFACAGCDLDLFPSDTKYDSGTGWPSFWKPLDNAIVAETDHSYGMVRTAVICRRCGGHLGHVFNDGPQPTGLRYCMNGVALIFKAAAA